MTRDEAFQMLSSDSTNERLKAARFLARNVQPNDIVALRRARQVETVSYIKTSLDLAIARLSNLPTSRQSDPNDEVNVPNHVRREIERKATESVARIILHEIASNIGLVELSATREVADFENSKTKRYLDDLKRIFNGIEQLKSASATPKPEEFDLAELLEDIVSAEVANKELDVSLHGPKPMVITSDPTLVRLAVCNGVRNAVEAMTECDSGESHPIVLTWGETDVDYWVAVLDKGPGIVGPIESAFEIGKSTKTGHSGFWLAIARQAMTTLIGSVTLQPATEGGARYEVRFAR